MGQIVDLLSFSAAFVRRKELTLCLYNNNVRSLICSGDCLVLVADTRRIHLWFILHLSQLRGRDSAPSGRISSLHRTITRNFVFKNNHGRMSNSSVYIICLTRLGSTACYDFLALSKGTAGCDHLHRKITSRSHISYKSTMVLFELGSHGRKGIF